MSAPCANASVSQLLLCHSSNLIRKRNTSRPLRCHSSASVSIISYPCASRQCCSLFLELVTGTVSSYFHWLLSGDFPSFGMSLKSSRCRYHWKPFSCLALSTKFSVRNILDFIVRSGFDEISDLSVSSKVNRVKLGYTAGVPVILRWLFLPLNPNTAIEGVHFTADLK